MKLKEILKSELKIIKPSDDELLHIKEIVQNFLSLIQPELKKVKADIIVGGSFAKNTVIKKKKYDVDFFVRFEKKSGNISLILEKILNKTIKKIKAKPPLKIEKIHGSRDYFGINFSHNQISFKISFEIVPVIKIKKAKEAVNVTDASPLHVLYVKRQISKKKNLADEIRLVKAFCYAQDCYGAESYINGFSGYALELLTCYYGSFFNLIKTASKWQTKKKIIIDPAKFYKKNEALKKLNKAKLQSPILLIDPTQADRNATASISYDCLAEFIKSCKSFLHNPNSRFFRKTEKSIDKEKLKKEAKKRKAKLIMLDARSNKYREDIAGAKLLKFFRFLLKELNKDFSVQKSEWIFNEEQKKAVFVFILKEKDKILVRGPPARLEKYAAEFRKKWPKCFSKNGIIYAVRKSRNIKQIINLSNLKTLGIKSIKSF